MALIAVPLTLLWLALTKEYSIQSAVLGYIVSLILLHFTVGNFDLRAQNLPSQIIGLVQFMGFVAVDTFVSGVTVAWRVVQPTMPIDPGLVEVEVQDEHEAIAALSAYAITITPGEMVIDFDYKDSKRMMVVHSLNVQETEQNGAEDQSRRLKILRRMLNLD